MSDPTEIRATKMAELLFGSKAIEDFKEDTGLEIRDIWGLSSTKTQCNQTVGKIEEDKECWICGFPIDIHAEKGDSLAPECEHVLPVVQARFFLSLYNSDMKESLDDNARKALLLEYDWAHSLCNQEKTDVSFIRSDLEKNFNVNESVIEELLKKIRNSKRKNSDKLIKQINEYGYKKWMKDRDVIIRKRINDIIKYLKNDRPDGIYNMILLAGTVDSISPENLTMEFKKYIQDSQVRKFIEYVKEDISVLLENETKLVLHVAKTIYDDVEPKMKRKEIFYRTLFNIVELDKDSIVQSIYNNTRQYSHYYNTIYSKIHIESPEKAEPTAIEFIYCMVYGYLYNLTFDLRSSKNIGIDKVFESNLKYYYYNSLYTILSKQNISLANFDYIINILRENFPLLNSEMDSFLQEVENMKSNNHKTGKKRKLSLNNSNKTVKKNKLNNRSNETSNSNNNSKEHIKRRLKKIIQKALKMVEINS
uniref:Uncharacterized protein n=1 Tax=viral metagenome TaxID=1070528 RepID=A0A6C0D5S2_9ZZZZ